MRYAPAILLLGLVAAACSPETEISGFYESVDYRTGVAADDYTSSGERGNVMISEIHWAGSVEGDRDAWVHDPSDVFIELQNKHNRPMHLTGWQLIVDTGENLDTLHVMSSSDRARRVYVLPARENGMPVEPNGYVVIAARRDGAFANADYFIDDLELPHGPFEITLVDSDDRLIDGAGDDRKPVFAGAWDRVTARSMERIQLIFGNRGNVDASWHSYSYNTWDGEAHDALRVNIGEAWRTLTYATPGMPNSPDYSGNVSSGSFE